jgi:hypothetical protein
LEQLVSQPGSNREKEMKIGPDVEGVSDGELIVAFDQLGQRGALVAATVNRYARVQLCLLEHHADGVRERTRNLF